jgi:hypothetical protein
MNNNRRQIRFRYKTLPIFLAMIILAGCSSGGAVVSPSVDEGEAITQVNQTTMEIPTKTPVPTDTSPPPTNTPEPTDTPPPPTRTPVPTYPPPPTATPFPDRNPKAMIAWKDLGLPRKFKALSPEEIGMQEGANAFTLSSGEKYNIAGSFLFANGDNPDTYIYGYTLLLPTSSKRGVFDQLIYDVQNYGGLGDYELLDGIDIGNHSKGVTGILDDQRLTIIAFRMDNIGAVVFLRHGLRVDPGIDAVHVAQVYAKSIDESTPYCNITSVRAVPGVDIPTFEVGAEGFYPQEGRFIMLDGAIEIGGETITIGAAKLGGTGETVDSDGSLSDVIGIDLMQQLAAKGYKDVQLPEEPIEFTLTVGGHFSQCEATQTVTWP